MCGDRTPELRSCIGNLSKCLSPAISHVTLGVFHGILSAINARKVDTKFLGIRNDELNAEKAILCWGV